ncbi:hypothetical protein GWI33_016087 [Rhynchophorus ferrugineus]|uniref:Uncharacterized protein n=1 Tax=Rhynchophorus ferrugineus TaxID=354439 RepID=A0A834M921_RHYFE|nr:hypothetical protein GWI33_016087 [Rhynchophorus ferrugineus]
MGGTHSKEEQKLQDISRHTKSIRSSLSTSPQNFTKERKDSIIADLSHSSTSITSLKGKVSKKKYNETLKNVQQTLTAVIKTEPVDLDGAAIETDSFVHVPINRQQRNSNSSTFKASKIVRSNAADFRQIEERFKTLKAEIRTAIKNNDVDLLRSHKAVLQVLAGNIDSLNLESNTPIAQRKESLRRDVGRMFGSVQKQLNMNRVSVSNTIRNTSLGDLNNIELQLAQNESLLDQVMKEKNPAELLTIKNNISTLSDRLRKVEITDDNLKNRILILTQKMYELKKTVDKLLVKREFESKLVKAQETLDRIKKNFNVLNSEETKRSLETLEDSVKKISEHDEVSKRKKKDLLVDISNYKKYSSDKKTIEQIVEENVVLRKKLKNSDKEITIIDQFINYWKNIEHNIDLNQYSKLSLLRMDNVLDEMQDSIYKMRMGIANKCDTNPPTLKTSQSVPKLNEDYGNGDVKTTSSDSGIIKTKARVYDVASPTIQYVNPVTTDRFSHIEEMKRNISCIKEKVGENTDHAVFKSKLEIYLKSLDDYVKDNNASLANKAVILSSEIYEILIRITMVELKQRIDIVTKKARSFNGSKYEKEFDKINAELNELHNDLDTLKVPSQYVQLVHEKCQLLEELGYLMQSFNNKPLYSVKSDTHDIKALKDKLAVLNDKVKRFVGTYKGVAYSNLERELNKILFDIGEYPDETVTEQINKDVERLLKILEHRSSLAESFKTKTESITNDESTAIDKIKFDLGNIKSEIDKTPEDDIKKCTKLQSRLGLVSFELGQISTRSNERLEKEKEILTNEVSSLRNVVDAKITLGQKPVAHWPDRDIVEVLPSYPKPDINKELELLQQKFENIKKEIDKPNADDIHKTYKLAQDVRKLLEQLNKYRFIKKTDLHVWQINLKNEMQQYVAILENDAKEAEDVISLERKLITLEALLRSKEQRDLKAMAEELQTIQSKLNKYDTNTTNASIRLRKTSVQQKTEELAQKLKRIEDEEIKFREQADKIMEIEEKTEALKPKIISFVGQPLDSKFNELDEATMKLIVSLENLEVKSQSLVKRKVFLSKELHKLGEILDSRGQQVEELISIEEKLEKASRLLDDARNKRDDIEAVKYYVKIIEDQIRQLAVNDDLLGRLDKCAKEYERIQSSMVELENDINNQKMSSNWLVTKSSNQTEQGTDGGHSKIYSFVIKKTTKGVQFADKTMVSVIDDDVPPILPKTKPPPLQWNPLSDIERKIDNLQSLCFSTIDEDQLNEIDNEANKLTIELKDLVIPRESPDNVKKSLSYEKLETIATHVETTLAEIKTLSKLESQLDSIGNQISGTLDSTLIDNLDQQLIQVQIGLRKIGNPLLKPKVDACNIRLFANMQIIRECKKMQAT